MPLPAVPCETSRPATTLAQTEECHMKTTTTLALLATTGVVAFAPTAAAQAKSPVIENAYTVWAKSIATADCQG